MTKAHDSTGSRREPSQRQLRVGEAVRHVLADLLMRGDFRDPALRESALTVTEVRMAPDLRRATAFVTRLGGGEMSVLLEALERAAPYLKGRIARKVRLRHTPDLVFAADDRFERAARIDRLLHGEG